MKKALFCRTNDVLVNTINFWKEIIYILFCDN
jgi:hypothetical protein